MPFLFISYQLRVSQLNIKLLRLIILTNIILYYSITHCKQIQKISLIQIEYIFIIF
jgi:hypothetical protein